MDIASLFLFCTKKSENIKVSTQSHSHYTTNTNVCSYYTGSHDQLQGELLTSCTIKWNFYLGSIRCMGTKLNLYLIPKINFHKIGIKA